MWSSEDYNLLPLIDLVTVIIIFEFWNGGVGIGIGIGIAADLNVYQCHWEADYNAYNEGRFDYIKVRRTHFSIEWCVLAMLSTSCPFWSSHVIDGFVLSGNSMNVFQWLSRWVMLQVTIDTVQGGAWYGGTDSELDHPSSWEAWRQNNLKKMFETDVGIGNFQLILKIGQKVKVAVWKSSEFSLRRRMESRVSVNNEKGFGRVKNILGDGGCLADGTILGTRTFYSGKCTGTVK